MRTLTFVGAGCSGRMPEVLAAPGVHVTAIGNAENPLRTSPFVDTFVTVDYEAHPCLAEALLARPDVLADLRGWVVFAEDTTPRLLARSDIPLADKQRILPARTEAGLAMLGSKVGLTHVLAGAGVRGPRSVVVHAPDDLPAARREIGAPLMIKGDGGGGGDMVRRVESPDDIVEVPAAWFPVVVQEALDEAEVSVEVLFRDGELAAWMYAEMLTSQAHYGPSTSRRYVDPPSRDFEADLARVGRHAGLHGFFNCSLFWCPEDGRHLIFELDPRPNAWHQFGPRLGVDWVELMWRPDTADAPRHPTFGRGTGRAVHLYPRQLVDGLDARQWAAVRPWALGRPGTWGMRNHRDRAVNTAERDDVRAALAHWTRLSAAIGLGAVWERTPRRVRTLLTRLGAHGAVARRIGTA